VKAKAAFAKTLTCVKAQTLQPKVEINGGDGKIIKTSFCKNRAYFIAKIIKIATVFTLREAIYG
jgi:hypothetical protein